VTLDRYEKVFGERPPTIVWYGSNELLQEVAEKAIATGKALSEADLLRAQGKKPPTGDVLY
jgi:hypothetical protein